jgi:hypothetical protein
MGLVPGATEQVPEPLRTAVRRVGIISISGSIVVIGVVAFWMYFAQPYFVDGPRNENTLGSSKLVGADSPPAAEVKSSSKVMSYTECLSLVSRTATQLGVAPINIVETEDMRMVRFVASDGNVLVTCSRPDGTVVITRSN